MIYFMRHHSIDHALFGKIIMKKTSILLSIFISASNLISQSSNPAIDPAEPDTPILKKKLPPTYQELDKLMYAKEDEASTSINNILEDIQKHYHKYDFSLSKCALKQCTIEQIKTLGIVPLTKCALSQKFCDLCTSSKKIWSTGTHQKIKSCIEDPHFDVNHPTIDGILPLHHSPYYPLENLTYTDITALDAQGNTILHRYSRTGDIRPLLHSKYQTKIKKIINYKNDNSETALLILAQNKIANKPITHIQYMRIWTYPSEKTDQLASIIDLLICGADPDIVNNKGICFSQLAAQHKELGHVLAKSARGK